nr:ion transporter [Atopomonas sediminilitoris]
MSYRERIYKVIYGTDTAAGRLFDEMLLVAILLSVAVVMLDSVEQVRAWPGEVLGTLEWIFTALFTVELILRLYCNPKPWRYVFSFYGMVDIIAVLPSYLSLFFGDAQYLLVVRILRLMRVFRVLRLVEYSKEARVLLVALAGSRKKILVFMLSVLSLVFCFGALMYVVEGPEGGFTSIPKGVYWAIVTLTTVGYGDIAPQSPLGQAIAGLVMLTGYSIIAVPTGIFSAEIVKAAREGDHVIHLCPRCQKAEHNVDASYCNRCGNALYPEAQAEAEAEAEKEPASEPSDKPAEKD